MHGTNSIAETLLLLSVVLTTAKLGAHIAIRLKQPGVLGELVAGVVLGHLAFAGIPLFERMKTDPAIANLSELGVILLLFQVGLESTVGQMVKVGISSLLVGTLGVVGPFVLGWGVGVWLLPAESVYVHVFLGAALSATSVGITARVLKDLRQLKSLEARVILGAAVIDDVLGLVILAAVTGIITAASQGSSLSYADIALVLGKAMAFLVVSLLLGVYLTPRLFAFASRLEATGVLVATGLAFCFLLAWLAEEIGLAPIVGAFAAGLVLEELHSRDFVSRGEHALDESLEPIVSFLTPVFFVLMGAKTDLRIFNQPDVFGLAAVLTVAAIVGKQLCALGVIGRRLDRLSIGIGMIPRGEVGLIFANIGLTLTLGGEPIVSPAIFSAVVVMVIVTTMVTPPALAWSFSRRGRGGGGADRIRSAAGPRG
jgi:Kef-type K+ transport system membrane component KefB